MKKIKISIGPIVIFVMFLLCAYVICFGETSNQQPLTVIEYSSLRDVNAGGTYLIELDKEYLFLTGERRVETRNHYVRSSRLPVKVGQYKVGSYRNTSEISTEYFNVPEIISIKKGRKVNLTFSPSEGGERKVIIRKLGNYVESVEIIVPEGTVTKS